MSRLLLLLLAAVLSAQDAVVVPQVALPLTVDGRPDEDFWRSAAVCTPFQVLGAKAQTTALRNAAWLAVQGGDLCIAYRLEEPELDGMTMVATDGIRIYEDDCVETFLSVDRAGRRLAHLLVNPRGCHHWEQRSGEAPSPTWYPVGIGGRWEAQAAIDRAGRQWTCELRISLHDVVGSNTVGPVRLYLNLTRHRPRGPEPHATWAPLRGASYLEPQSFVAIDLVLPAPPPVVAADSGRAGFTSRLEVPGLLFPGTPVRVVPGQGVHRLPGSWRYADAGVDIDAGVTALVAGRAQVAGRPEATCTLAIAPTAFGDPILSGGERELLAGPEAFRLKLAEDGLEIIGRAREGVLRGLATYGMLAARARAGGVDLPAMLVYDAPRLDFRAWQLTVSSPAARLREAIDAAFFLRLNHVLISMDSFKGGTAFPFTVADIGDPARSKAEWIEAFAYARARGIEPIPYLASWSRTQYITQHPQYQHLQTPDLPGAIAPTVRNLDVANPEAVDLMLALQGEVIDTLKAKALCIGFDELHYADMAGSPLAQAKGWKKSDWVVAALTANADFLRRRGVGMLVWGDMLDPGQNGRQLDQSGPELLARLPRDMTILDWKYEGGFDRATEFPSIGMFKASGRRTIGCPWWQPNNIARIAYSVKAEAADGMCLTSWNGTNLDQLPPELARALGLAAWLSWSPEDGNLSRLPSPPDVLLRFAGPAGHPALLPSSAARPVTAPAGLVGGEALASLLGLPAETAAQVLRTGARNHRGNTLEPFSGPGGQPAAVVARGGIATVRNGRFGQGLVAWTVQPATPDRLATVEDGCLVVRRDPKQAYQRVFQNVQLPVACASMLRFRYRALSGAGLAYVYPGDGKIWDEARVFRTPRLAEKGWTAVELQLPAAAALRICLTVEDAGAEVVFDDVSLTEVDAAGAATKAVSTVIPVGTTATALTFLHTTPRQELSTTVMHDNVRKYADAVVATYVVRYEDGGEVVIPLNFRTEVTAWNDTCLGREQDLGIFGTIAGSTFINIPTFTWRNPRPGSQIAAVEILPGNRLGMDLLLLGLEVEP